MATSLVVTFTPTEEDRTSISDLLIAFNNAVAGPSGFEPIAVLLKDDEGNSAGGLWGKFSYNWLFVELLIVPDRFRGQGWGRRLVSAAEKAAVERDCVGVWLDTHGFQAPEFYKALGYKVFGELPDYPRGVSRYFLRKLLPRSEATLVTGSSSLEVYP